MHPRPSAPRPDEDAELADAHPPAPVHYAEQALLGALLLEPARLDGLGPLAPEHFDAPAHSALYTAMHTAPVPDAEQHRRAPVWLDRVLQAARPQAPGLTASYLHTLVHRCPWPGHAAAYAHMIQADHTRRTVREHADRLAQAATEASLPDPTATVLAQCDTLSSFLNTLSSRFAPHPGSLPRTPHPAPARRTAGEEALEEERALLACATAQPSRLREMRWLQPDDFVLPLHGQLFTCLTALVHRREPIDPVTVLWEAQHQHLLHANFTPADLIGLLATPVGTPEHWGEKILRRALLAQAHTTAVQIRAFTDDAANTPHQLATGSRRALANLTALGTRWQRASHPPATPRSPAVPRAGPRLRAAPAPPTTRVSR
ncbi:replicative DNA helicase [Streptomyces rimosus subsp. rimosus]|uniref:DnaB-like helicase N-terminal domain-containing protein n=1 Tax=Streptomyces rimosus TaxID=1927 RepID=UPI0006B25D8A|nr:DnaB-like helicase N-terminal domain-containing protein [Streptomyces rimosus]KOT89751.1 replicative DNA helicase [Streptomyces rimosus subsp. rimosus]